MIPPVWLNWIFVIFGLLFSVFYGLKACDAFGVNSKEKPWAWHIHQFWFNFLGCGIGWCVAWLLTLRLWGNVLDFHPWSDLGLILVAFIGITGHLPYAISGILSGLKLLALKITGMAN